MSEVAYVVGGKPIALGERVGRGGEGEVLCLGGDGGLVVKLYTNPDAERAAKIAALCSAGLGARYPDVALPLAAVHTSEGAFAGFVMRRAGDCQPIHELLTPSSRRRHFPTADWRFLTRVALNVARVVAQVHSAGIVIGDINSSGFLVSRQATVTLIDADSLQYGRFRCRVGMPEYTPPELQGRRFDEVDRTADHDAFGLATMVFQILALGRHPFAGVVRGRGMAIESAIARDRFAYSDYREKTVEPPAGALRLTDLPKAVRVLFERAFAVRIGPRPTALEWVSALRSLESCLISCGYRPSHVYPASGEPCPWCRIESQIKRPVFAAAPPQPPMGASATTALEADVSGAIRVAMANAGPGIAPRWPVAFVLPSEEALKLRRERERDVPRFSSLALRIRFSSSLTDPLVEKHQEATKHADAAIRRWRDRLGTPKTERICALLSERLCDLRTFSRNRPVLLRQAWDRFVQHRAASALATMVLDDARVQGLGTALKRKLAAHHIGSAADLTPEALGRVPGLGRRRMAALLLWRDCVSIEAENTVSRTDVQATAYLDRETARLDAHSAVLSQAVARAKSKLEAHVEGVVRTAGVIDPAVSKLIRKRDQLRCDLAYIGV